jgi:putative ABC transport system substrate-binding protein
LALGGIGPYSYGHKAFLEGLQVLGYVEGKNLRIEHRFANNKPDLLPGLAVELVRLPVAVIVAGDSAAIRPVREATRSIPIVMTVSGDPVREGHIASLARPGGNVTGLTNVSHQLWANGYSFSARRCRACRASPYWGSPDRTGKH